MLSVLVLSGPAVTGPVPATPTQVTGPNPRLADLADGEARDLGAYECEPRAPELNCKTIFDYSRINYDRNNQRFIIFGGGHAATGRTDIDAFDMHTLEWRSIYPTMRCDEVAAKDLDPRGFHRKTGHPVARHSYDQNVIAEIDGQSWLLLFSNEGFAGHCHAYKSAIDAPAAFPLTAPDAQWTYGPSIARQWGYGGTAEFDPISGFVILLSSSSPGMWIYDPAKQELVASVRNFAPPAKNSSNLFFNPRDGFLYLIDRASMQVRRIRLNRNDWQNSAIETVATSGRPPAAFRNLAYDAKNHIAGGIHDGKFFALDMQTFEWQSLPIKSTSATSASLASVHSHAIDYDPVNNVFIVVSGKPDRFHTWAFRFKN
ncbi:MAG: hypothetical protein KDJ27_01315 [Gammaproteobacteria bacterium]|nr:hypothetical protein [Gammaproteobacteria bacterium]